jgi:hypothetical protein
MWRKKTCWTCLWKKCEKKYWKCETKCEKNAFENPVGKVELW